MKEGVIKVGKSQHERVRELMDNVFMNPHNCVCLCACVCLCVSANLHIGVCRHSHTRVCDKYTLPV